MEALIQVLESTIAVRDPYTLNHQRRVTRIACTIGVEPSEELRNLRMAGVLHDLGKLTIPSDLLTSLENSFPFGIRLAQDPAAGGSPWLAIRGPQLVWAPGLLDE